MIYLYLELYSVFFFLRYYRYNEELQSVDPDYPKPSSKWLGVPDNIKAAFMSRDQSKNAFFYSVP